MTQNFPLRCLNRQLGESDQDYNERREAIFENATDSIDFYGCALYELGSLSFEQCADLREAAEIVSAFGERGEKWYDEAQRILRNA